jgi:hypothetical protein
MKTFAFIQTTSIQKAYNGLVLKYQRYDSTMEFIKIGLLVMVWALAIFSYIYYVNRSSTEWYFLRQENQKLNIISFDFEILKTKLLERKQEDRESLQTTNIKRDVINIKAEVVKIPDQKDFALNNTQLKSKEF